MVILPDGTLIRTPAQTAPAPPLGLGGGHQTPKVGPHPANSRCGIGGKTTETGIPGRD